MFMFLPLKLFYYCSHSASTSSLEAQNCVCLKTISSQWIYKVISKNVKLSIISRKWEWCHFWWFSESFIFCEFRVHCLLLRHIHFIIFAGVPLTLFLSTWNFVQGILFFSFSDQRQFFVCLFFSWTIWCESRRVDNTSHK